MDAGGPRLMAIIELGGYPNFTPLYESLGFSVEVVNSQRKARNLLKKSQPDVIVCEYNFQSDFRDRTSNLETLMAVLQKYPRVQIIVFYMPEHESKMRQFAERYAVNVTLSFPVDVEKLRQSLQALNLN